MWYNFVLAFLAALMMFGGVLSPHQAYATHGSASFNGGTFRWYLFVEFTNLNPERAVVMGDSRYTHPTASVVRNTRMVTTVELHRADGTRQSRTANHLGGGRATVSVPYFTRGSAAWGSHEARAATTIWRSTFLRRS